MTSHRILFTPARLGQLDVPNRILMAPMTRNRATADGTPTPMMAAYYAQRADAGLIVSEMIYISAAGKGYLGTPGIHTPDHIAAWRTVTDAVHARGGRIVAQIAHAGRISHPLIQADGRQPVAPSAVAPVGKTFTTQGPKPFETPRALDRHEIPGVAAQFGAAALAARESGFDGIELHAANGYLLDQFLRDGSNQRTDEYGGTAVQRARVLLEVVDAVVVVWGPGRVGVRLSPLSPFNSMSDSDPAATFTTVASLLANKGLAYLHVIEPVSADRGRLTPQLRAAFGGAVVANGAYDAATADAVLARGEADAVAFGVPFIANPDLVRRLTLGAPLNAPDQATFYVGGERGYTDYAALVA